VTSLLASLADSSSSSSSCYVATAHHLGDQAETLLLKLTRGAHISNLRGMQWRSSSSSSSSSSSNSKTANDGSYTVIRPLLGLRKSELVQYLQHLGISWCEDASNATLKYSRNRVRLQVLPALRRDGPNGLTNGFFKGFFKRLLPFCSSAIVYLHCCDCSLVL
jgi:tRNA(Ile)-lysidine synthase